jgi:hypothetical protein
LNISHVVQKVRDFGAVALCLPPRREYIVQVGERHDAGVTLANELPLVACPSACSSTARGAAEWRQTPGRRLSRA